MQRRRRGTSHSKSGCESCRRRRLRCDEQKPQCLRCMRDGATCERDSLNLYRPSQQSAPDSLGITTYSPPFCVPGTPGERKALHYLSTYGASDIGGWLGADFWNRIVLQRCQTESVIRIASVALSRAHFERVSKPCLEGTLTHAHINKASKALRRYIESHVSPSKPIILICCIIFHAIESLRSCPGNAARHLNGGFLILKGWHAELVIGGSCADEETYEEILEMFLRLDQNATSCDFRRTVSLDSICSHNHRHVAPLDHEGSLKVARFVTVHNVIRHHTGLTTRLYRLLAESPDQSVQGSEASPRASDDDPKLETEYRQFTAVVEMFAQSNASRVSKNAHYKNDLELQVDTSSVLLVKFQSEIGICILDERLHDGEYSATWELHADSLLQTAEDLLNKRKQIKRLRDVERLGSFSTQMGVVGGLTLLAQRTKSPEVRSRAVALGHQVEGREGCHEVFLNFVLWMASPQPKPDYYWYGRPGH